MSKNGKTFLILVFLFALFTGTPFSFAKTTVKKLTSKKSAKKVIHDLPSASFSTGVKKHSFGLGIGQVFLRGDFADRGSNRMTLDLYYNYSVSYTFDLLTNIHYNDLNSKGEQVILRGATAAIKFKLYQIDEFAPFVMAGLGIYAPQEKTQLADGSYIKSSTEATMGWNGGFGADLRLNKQFMIGMLVHYHDPFDVEQDTAPKVSGSYTKLLFTIFYSFH